MDQLRGLAIVLVVAYHAKTVLGRFVPERPEEMHALLALFAPFRMPLLMFLSGMLLARSLAKPLRPYAVGKLRRIAWPYVVWSTIFLVVADKASPERLLALPVNPPNYLWYLHNLVLYYALARLLMALRVPFALMIPVGLAAAVVADAYGVQRFFFLLVFFAAGEVYARHREWLRLERRGLWLSLCAAAAVASAIVSALGAELKYEPMYVFVPAVGIALAVLLARRYKDSRPAGVLGLVGRDSIVFYVAHYPVQWAFYWMLREAGIQAPVPMYVAGLVVGLAAGFALAALRHRSRLADAGFELPPLHRPTARLG